MLVAQPKRLILNKYDNCVVGVSLYKIFNRYRGNCLRVRRSSDNTEQDIGFINGYLDAASIVAFCGEGDGFVKTWYDQSGAGLNAVQNTNGNQPKIVSSGTLLEGISFTGSSSQYLTWGTDARLNHTTDMSFFVTLKTPDSLPSGSVPTVGDGQTNSMAMYLRNNAGYGFGARYYNADSTFSGIVPQLSSNLVYPQKYALATKNEKSTKNLDLYVGTTKYSVTNNSSAGSKNFTEFMIGKGSGFGATYFTGSIYSVLIFKKLLPDDGMNYINTELMK